MLRWIVSPRAVVTLVLMVIALGGCAGGATSSPAATRATPTTSAASPPTTTASTSSSSAASLPTDSASAAPTPTEATMPDFTLTSSAFKPGGEIPRRFTCDGDDVSPDLEWAGAPPGAAAFALVVDDPDARGFVHWTVLDFEATETGALPSGFSSSPDAPQQGTNDFGRVGYGGPCPPSGTHRYRFLLYALGAPLALSGAPKSAAVRAALDKAQVVGRAELEAKYTRQR
jgi:Raf kinase inhibitor-like YbhB/YbcL family protein